MEVTAAEEFLDFLVEVHKVETKDGYIVSLYRVKGHLYLKEDPTTEQHREKNPVLCLAGILCSGVEWICTTKDKALPYHLMKEGYECWLGCFRGSNRNNAAKPHRTHSLGDKKFWDFSIDDIGYYDVPAMIDYILEFTKRDKLFYVGHSLGTTTLLAALASLPEYNEKIEVMIAFTPAIYLSHCSIAFITKFMAPLYTFLSKFKFFYRRGVASTTYASNMKSMFPCISASTRETMTVEIMTPLVQSVTKTFHRHQMDKEQYKMLSGIFPGGSSMKVLCHMMQAIYKKTAEAYDHGREVNMKKYGSPTPKQYIWENVTAPVAMFTSDHDYLIPPEDVIRLKSELKNVIYFKKIEGVKLYHGDFMFGKDSLELIFKDVIAIFNEYRNKQ